MNDTWTANLEPSGLTYWFCNDNLILSQSFGQFSDFEIWLTAGNWKLAAGGHHCLDVVLPFSSLALTSYKYAAHCCHKFVIALKCLMETDLSYEVIQARNNISELHDTTLSLYFISPLRLCNLPDLFRLLEGLHLCVWVKLPITVNFFQHVHSSCCADSTHILFINQCSLDQRTAFWGQLDKLPLIRVDGWSTHQIFDAQLWTWSCLGFE